MGISNEVRNTPPVATLTTREGDEWELYFTGKERLWLTGTDVGNLFFEIIPKPQSEFGYGDKANELILSAPELCAIHLAVV